MISNFLNLSFRLDEFSVIMIALVTYIGICVISFASRYMQGNVNYRLFFIHFIALIVSVILMVSADNLILIFVTCCFNNWLLVRLMIHKSSWKAAKASGIIAAKNYILSAMCLGSAFIILYLNIGETSLSVILNQEARSVFIILALVLILIAAMIQSAIWPFHKWLLSSLNSPTPVSAIMHAGLINGGGFLLVRFAPLYLKHPTLLTIIFSLGMITALLGTLWKLMQSDVKRMLACSTMGQMGFMLVQCGLGLFLAAVAHLVWHGMFKAYLFLASGSAAQEKRFDLVDPPKPLTFMCAIICGIFGSFGFAYASGKSWLADDTTLVLMVIAFITASQLSLSILRVKTLLQSLLFAIIITILAGFVYGSSVYLISWLMESTAIMQPQPLNNFHIIGIITMLLAWLIIVFGRNEIIKSHKSLILKHYVKALNASQPHSTTITAHRNHYRYK